MNCIRIVNDLAGGNRPDWILKAWIGLVLPIQVPFRPFSRGQMDISKIGGVPDGATFPVDTQLAVAILALHQPESAAWWIENTNVRAELIFNSDCSELIEGVPSVISPKTSPLQTTVSEFIRAVQNTEGSVYWLRSDGVADLFNEENVATFLRSALTPAAVLLITNEVVKECAFAIECASTEEMMQHVLDEGHKSLRNAHRIATQSGVKLPLEWVDRPLCMVEALEREGFINIIDGNVHPVPLDQLPLNLTKH